MDYKKYNIRILSVLLGVLVFSAVLNYFVNPFNVFPQNQSVLNRVRPALKRQERLTKQVALRSIKDCDTIFIGTSRVDFSLPEDYYQKITGKKAANLAFEKSNFSEQKYMIYKALKHQPGIKTVLLEVDFDFSYSLKESDTSSLENYDRDGLHNYTSVLLSGDALSASFKTLMKSFGHNKKEYKGYLQNGVMAVYHNKNIDYKFDETINQYKNTGKGYASAPDLSLLKLLIKDLNKQGVNVVLCLQPMHTTVYEVVNQNGAWDKVEIFKKELAKIQPFYDFYYPSEYSNEEITPDMQYFFEASHCTYLLGEKILDKIFLDKGGYGYLVREDNVDVLNKQHRRELEKWEKENPQLVERVRRIRENGLKRG